MGYRSNMRSIPAALCLLAAGCAGEHLFRAQDRKIEELRLERARQDEAVARARESLDALREEWKGFLARETSASKEAAANQAALRKLVQRLDDLDGKRARLEERLRVAETKTAELNQAFSQVSSLVKTTEGELFAWRGSRSGASLPAGASFGAVGGDVPQDRRAAAAEGTASRSGAFGSLVDGVLHGQGPIGVLLYGAVLLVLGACVALTCVFIGARLRPWAVARDGDRARAESRRGEPPQGAPAPGAAQPAPVMAPSGPGMTEPFPSAAQPAPASSEPAPPGGAAPADAASTPARAPPTASRTPSAPARLVFPVEGVEDFFAAAEKASTGYVRSRERPEAEEEGAPEPRPGREEKPEAPELEHTQVLEHGGDRDDPSNTEVLPGRDGDEAENSETVVVDVDQAPVSSRSAPTEGAATEILEEAGEPQPTQMISEAGGPRAPRGGRPRTVFQREPAAVKGSTRKLKRPEATAAKAPEERDLLDELETIIGYKMGENRP